MRGIVNYRWLKKDLDLGLLLARDKRISEDALVIPMPGDSPVPPVNSSRFSCVLSKFE